MCSAAKKKLLYKKTRTLHCLEQKNGKGKELIFDIMYFLMLHTILVPIKKTFMTMFRSRQASKNLSLTLFRKKIYSPLKK